MKETKTKKVCAECGKELSDGHWEEFDGKILCRECLEYLTVVCQDCGERMYRGANAGTSSHPLCDTCEERSYTYCEQCGRLLRNEDAYYFDDDDSDCPYCQSCFERTNRRTIKDYYYKPDPIFYGESDRFFGVELEIDGAGEDSVYAEDVLAVGNNNAERIYCKHDGSLSDGFEIVTHPMTLDYHINEMPWRSVVKTARNLGYTSHQAETCGLHVHVNRDSLGSTSEEQDATIGRILYFVEKNWNELLIFSRRTEYQLSRWAARYGYKDQPKEMLEHAKKGYGGRYTCVNLTNTDTIEFRIFRGTLKYNTLIATLQIVNRICDVAFFYSDDQLRSLSWSKFVESITEPELIQYLKERRLYVNESVQGEEKL